ncbi:hypothetical protein FJY90_04295 [Candidatus Gottesmanbacteria bacterium]|nr:hypothetical protein [Candidatus Gottesmanbacteria bacterium]
MGKPIDVNASVANMVNIARISNIQHQKDETQQKLFNLALKEETIRKETQVQTQQKVESAVNQTKVEKKEAKKKNRKKRQKTEIHDKNQKLKSEQYDSEEQHIDLKIY